MSLNPARWMFAGSSVRLYLGFRVTGAQLNKRKLIPSSVCKKQRGASLNEQPQPFFWILTAILSYSGEVKAKSIPGKARGKKIVVSLISLIGNFMYIHIYIYNCILRLLTELTTSVALAGLRLCGDCPSCQPRMFGTAVTATADLTWSIAAAVYPFWEKQLRVSTP